MTGNRIFQVLSLLAAAGLIAAAGLFQGDIEDLRYQADQETGTEESRTFAELKLIQAIPGIGRALLIDYLWIRTERLKQAGQFHDAEQVTSMICALQPRFPAVWRNRAWNLAYNISVKSHTAPERWYWVKRGIELLRDEGLKYNPKSLQLYLELSWIYLHKLGEGLDDMHWAYKRYHAAEFHRVLGAPPVPVGAEAQRLQRYDEWFRPIVEAPATEAELLADAQVAAYVRQLADLNVRVGLDVLDTYNAWSDDPLVKIMGHPGYPTDNDAKKQLRVLMTDPARAAVRDKVVAYSRRRVLVDTYHMKPSWMLHMAAKYGPLDWRAVWSHSLYWSSYGLYNCKGLDLKHMDPINTGRIVLTSLKSLVGYGQISMAYDPQPEMRGLPLLQQRFDWRVIDVCQSAYLEMNEFYSGQKGMEQTFGKFIAGHKNWVRRAVQLFYLAGKIDKADEYLDYLKRTYGRRDRKLYSLDLEQFVYQSINRQGLTQREAVAQFVSAMVSRAYEDIALGETLNFNERIDQARFFWTTWNEMVQGDTRKVLEDFESIQANWAFQTLIRQSLEGAMSIWEYVPPLVQQSTYDQLAQTYRPICEQQNINFDKAFPEPVGMEEFRQQVRRMQIQQSAPGQDTGAPWRMQMPN